MVPFTSAATYHSRPMRIQVGEAKFHAMVRTQIEDFLGNRANFSPDSTWAVPPSTIFYGREGNPPQCTQVCA
jgi:hypothetical protein